MNDHALVREALSFVPACDRDVWVRMGMAVKAALGSSGWDIWRNWSESDDSFREKDARAVWQSIREIGGIGAGSLFAEAKNNGWQGDAPRVDPVVEEARRNTARNEARREAMQRAETHKAASARAMRLLNESVLANHPYLTNKGLPGEVVYVHDDRLMVPMWDAIRYGRQLNSLQSITAEGEKKFLPGGKAKGSVYKIGAGSEIWYCEGLATGLSIRNALKAIYRQATVVVCFSANNLQHVAQGAQGFVVADHDSSGTGERVARATGLPWWMPPDIDTDANDFARQYGVRNLAVMLNKMRRA